MNTQTARACATAILGGLAMVFLLFLPAIVFGAPPTPTSGAPKGATPTPTAKKAAVSPAAPAVFSGVDFQFTTYTARGTHPGENAIYRLAIVNSGGAPANAAQATLYVPANAAYVANSAQVQGGGALTVSGKTIQWAGVVGAGGAVTITYHATLPNAIGTVVTSTASVYDPGAIAVLPLANRLTVQAPSGLDDFGYTYQDSLAPASGVTFSWVPTTTPSSRLDFGILPADDVVTGPVDIGFTFQFYTGTYTQAYINTNGLVMFGAENAANKSNIASPIPSLSGSHNFASCLWSDMIVYNLSHGVWVEHYGSAPNRTTVITVLEPYWAFPNTPPALFQMILSETSNRIKCQYAKTAGLIYNSGGYSAIGLENFDGTLGLQYFFSNPGSPLVTIGPLEDHLAIQFTPGTLVRPAFTTSAMDVSYNVHPGDVATYTLHVRNNGNANGTATTLQNPIPPGTQFVPGSAHVQGGGAVSGSPAGVSWSGSVNAGQAVTVTFQLTVPVTLGAFFTDTATINDSQAAKPVVIQNPFVMQVLPPTSGGPDDFGYTYRDSHAPGGPAVTFSWVPTTTPTSKLNFGAVVADDIVTGPVPLGFAFNFYGRAYTQTFISTNGLVSFGSGSDANTNVPIPTPGGAMENSATCFWFDLLEANASQGVWVETHGSPGNRIAVITFRTAYFETAPITTTPPALFQMILYETSNQIKCQYLETPGPVDASGGRGATIGLENADGTTGIQYYYQPIFSSPTIIGPMEPGLAILFTPGSAAPAFSASTKLASPQMHPGERVTYTLSVVNDGPVPSTVTTANDPIPPGAAYVNGSAQVQGGGLLSANGSEVQWAGTVGTGSQVTITFAVNLPAGSLLTNTATISDPHSIRPVIRTALTPIQPSSALGVGLPTYIYRDSYAPGITYSWVPTDVSSSLLPISVGNNDDGYGQVPLGFAFKFFDRSYTSALVSTNGLVMFNPVGTTSPLGQPIPTPGTVDNYATCFLEDQAIGQPGEGIWYETLGSAPHRRALITFVLSDTLGVATAPLQYQMILREDDGSLLCQYADMSGSTFGDGRQAVIGVEGRFGNAGLQYFGPRTVAPFIGPIENSLAILFRPETTLFLPVVRR